MNATPDLPWSDADMLDYVRMTARLQALPLDDAQAARVAAHLGRTRVLALLLGDFPLTMQDEIAEVFCPAPFPSADPASASLPMADVPGAST